MRTGWVNRLGVPTCSDVSLAHRDLFERSNQKGLVEVLALMVRPLGGEAICNRPAIEWNHLGAQGLHVTLC